MIRLVKAKRPYKPRYGDLVCQWFNEESPKYLGEDSPGTDRIIPLACANPNPWDVLEKVFEIDASPIVAKYKCPYTNYEHFAIIPVALLLNGDVDYNKIKFHSPSYLMDWEFHRHMLKDKRLELYEIQKILLGSGYTNSTMVYDGDCSKIQRRVNLNNGDALWVYTWEWHNK